MLQYLYELDYRIKSEEGAAPAIHTHATMWCLGKDFRIRGLKAMAADNFKSALSQFNVYGEQNGLTISYFEDFVTGVKGLCEEKHKEPRTLRDQVVTHIHDNTEKWAKKQDSEARFLESIYLLILQEIQRNPDFTAVLKKIRAKCLGYLDPESDSEALGSEDLSGDEC